MKISELIKLQKLIAKTWVDNGGTAGLFYYYGEKIEEYIKQLENKKKEVITNELSKTEPHRRQD